MQFWFGGTISRKLRKKNLTKDYVQLVRQKRRAYVKQTKTFHWGYQCELVEQLARKRFKSKFKKKNNHGCYGVLLYCPKEDNQTFYDQCLSFLNLLHRTR